MPQLVAGFSFELDHIISIKHGGSSLADNLAYSCPICNGNKGSDLGTILPDHPGEIVRFFNPRKDNWFEHFDPIDGLIQAKTAVGAATIKIFAFNQEQDIVYRQKLASLGLFP